MSEFPLLTLVEGGVVFVGAMRSPAQHPSGKNPSLREIFGPGGILAHRLPAYEFRPSQLAMAQAVLEAIRGRHHLCVEAGTGTGKTLAYLIPALFIDKRVIVSTATKNLQEQLLDKDIPFMRRHIFPELAATCMKGRQNYLCLKRFYEAGSQRSLPGGGREQWERLSRWVRSTQTGDRAELEWLGDEDPAWAQLDARSETCTGQKCPHFQECFVTRMRQRALQSDLVVVNHALLFASLALESDEIGRVLPDFSVLILDEAHEVEDIASVHFGKRISTYQVEELCRDLLKVLPGAGREVPEIQRRSARLFEGLPGGEGRYPLSYRGWSEGPGDGLREELQARYSDLAAALRSLYHRLRAESGLAPEADPPLRRLDHLTAGLEEIFEPGERDSLCWYEKRGRGVFLHLTPVDIAPYLRASLLPRSDSVILTSATLTTQGNFDFLKGRLGLTESAELVVPSEFDYTRQAMLFIPRRFPEPRSEAYLPHALRCIREILKITQGHAFLLFTSLQQMDRIYGSLRESLPYPLLCQGVRPKNVLLEQFRETPHAVLCASASFWQGVDVRGDALRAVIIDKLPFPVPGEPVIAARLRRLEEQGENPFLGYSVPEAIITLKQGLGRLIRSRQDRGILAILDSRLYGRSYGPLFLKSLPNCSLTDNIEVLKNFYLESGSCPNEALSPSVETGEKETL